jgi:integrase
MNFHPPIIEGSCALKISEEGNLREKAVVCDFPPFDSGICFQCRLGFVALRFAIARLAPQLFWSVSAGSRDERHRSKAENDHDCYFLMGYCSEPRLSFNKVVVTGYRIFLENRGLAAGTINGRLAAVLRLAYEAADAGLLSPELAASIRRVRGVKKLGVRLGNRLTAEEVRRQWQAPDPNTLKGKRDRAILAVLLGCGLRRASWLIWILRICSNRTNAGVGENDARRVDSCGRIRYRETISVRLPSRKVLG